MNENAPCIEALTIRQELNDLASKIERQRDFIANMPLDKNRECSKWTKASPGLEEALSVMIKASESISSCSTRMTLLFKTSPSANVSSGILLEMGTYCDHLASSVEVAFAPEQDACFYLQKMLSMSVRRIQTSLLELVHSLSSGNDPSNNWNSLTGIIWEACKALSSIPKSNKNAIRATLLQFSLTIKDTIDEFKERVTEVDEGDTDVESSLDKLSMNDESNINRDEFDDLVEYMEGDDDVLTVEEIICIREILSLLRTARYIIRLVNNIMCKSSEVDESNEPTVCWAEAACACVEQIVDNIGNLGISLYPPLQQEKITEELNLFDIQLRSCLRIISRHASDANDIKAVDDFRTMLQQEIRTAMATALDLDA